MPGFELEPDGAGRFRASGELTFATASAALGLGERLLAPTTEARIDLSGVQEGDSAGLAVLIEWLAVQRSRGGSLVYAAVPEQMLAIARISGLEDVLLQGSAAAGPSPAGASPASYGAPGSGSSNVSRGGSGGLPS